DLAQIRTFGRLIYGENIPTLEEALREVIENTMLDFVWIDVKDPGIVGKVTELQYEAIYLAEVNNRSSLTIVLGIPNQEILNSYLTNKQRETPVLIELDINTALRDDINCVVWAPRWTTDISLKDISDAKNSNKKVIIWTLDVHEYIQEFLFNSDVDGILSNYPSLISGMYYTQ
ncbi:MAG: hypothetical protein MUO34_07840, partial [Ignavibacteriaceae bacterium]|nr:hypothetical protein [Ignavibacteriaceae bacterium]